MRSKFRLGDLCEFHRGASVPRARMSADGDLIYIHYGDLYKGFSIKIDVENPQKSLPFISKQEPIKQHQWLEDQDIVYVLTSETVEDLGHSFLFNNPEQRPAVAGTETTIVRVVRRDLLLPAYLNYVMHSPRFCALLRQYVKGMKVFRVHPDDVARIEIEAPSLMDQQAVVDTLDALYEKEMLNNRLNDYLAELCELIVSRSEATDGALSDICTQVTDKVSCTEAQIDSYVSTESLLADKNGRQLAASVPQTGKVVVYKAGDTLVSNIRPYFKKIWFAENDGTCSGDVVVFRANNPSLAPYLYAILRSDKFFDYVMSGAKGTKMPRGDKKQMMSYGINPYCPERDLEIIAFAVYGIGASNQENQYLSSLRDSLLPKLMSGEIDTSKVELSTLPNNHLV